MYQSYEVAGQVSSVHAVGIISTIFCAVCGALFRYVMLCYVMHLHFIYNSVHDSYSYISFPALFCFTLLFADGWICHQVGRLQVRLRHCSRCWP